MSSAFATAGFQDAMVSALHTPTTPSRHLFEPGRPIDWAFVRGADAGLLWPGSQPGQSVGSLPYLVHFDRIAQLIVAPLAKVSL